jgi:phosphoglycolate phosphatase
VKQNTDLLIFDWDGTLFDSIDWIVECLKAASTATGLSVPSEREARSVIGLSLQSALETLYPGEDEETAMRLVMHYREIYHTRPLSSLGLYEGVHELLQGLKAAGYRLAVATGKARSGLDAALDETGTRHYFETTRCADETASKPDPQMLWEILEALEVERDRAVMIGDSLHDLRMAQRAGMRAIGVSQGANQHEELLSLSPVLCIPKIVDLHPHFVQPIDPFQE